MHHNQIRATKLQFHVNNNRNRCTARKIRFTYNNHADRQMRQKYGSTKLRKANQHELHKDMLTSTQILKGKRKRKCKTANRNDHTGMHIFIGTDKNQPNQPKQTYKLRKHSCYIT